MRGILYKIRLYLLSFWAQLAQVILHIQVIKRHFFAPHLPQRGEALSGSPGRAQGAPRPGSQGRARRMDQRELGVHVLHVATGLARVDRAERIVEQAKIPIVVVGWERAVLQAVPPELQAPHTAAGHEVAEGGAMSEQWSAQWAAAGA